MPSGSMSQVFVGRQREMSELRAALDDAIAGHGRLVMLAGEPGIGKTRIAQELASHAESLGVQTFWGWCHEQEGAPPYWPWVQPIRDYINLLDSEKLRSQMGLGAADIAEVIPEVRQILPELAPPPVLEPEQARFRLFDSITTFFKAAAQTQPLMLVLDDLHWADKPSLMLLEFLAKQLAESRILVVGAYRDAELTREHHLSETLIRLYGSRLFYSTALAGLESADVGPFIEAASGSEASQQLIDAVYTHTEGNPFFMSEVIRLLSERGELEDASKTDGPVTLGMPRGVLEVVRQRLNRLSPECHQVLSNASIVGRDFDFRLLSILSGEITEDQLLQAIDEAVIAHLIQDSVGMGDRYQFSHAVVQQTLAGELTTSRQVRLHARIAEALETIYGNLPGDHVTELAHHFTQAAPVLGLEKMVKYLTLAGERALAAHAHDDAIAHFRRGLTAKGVDPENESEAIDGAAAALFYGLGRSLAATNRRREAAANLRAAFEYYAQEGDGPRAVEIAAYPFTPGIGRVRVTPLIARGLELVDPESHDAGRLLSRYGLALSSEMGDHEGAQAAFERALIIAHREGDAQLETQTLMAASQNNLFAMRLNEGLNMGLRAIDLARRSGSHLAEAQARISVSGILNILGQSYEAEPHAYISLELAEKIRDQALLLGALWHNQAVHYLTGNCEKARNFGNRGLAISPVDPRLLGLQAVIEFETGNFDCGNAHLDKLVEAAHLGTPGPTFGNVMLAAVVPVAVRATGSMKHLDLARGAGESVVSSPFAIPMFAMWARTGLAMNAVHRQDRQSAEEVYAALKSDRDLCGPFGSVFSMLGLLSGFLGRLDQAIEYFEETLTDSLSYLYTGWTHAYHAEALLKRNGPGDSIKAKELLEKTLTESTRIGMPPLAGRVSHLMESALGQQGQTSAYPSRLTQREVEVLSQLAQGKTNREIARELVLSERTVQRHIANIYAKINVRNRAEATTFALSHLAPSTKSSPAE